MARVELSVSLFNPSLRYLNTSRMPVIAKDKTGVTVANLLLAQMLTFLLGQLLWHHSTQDHTALKVARIQASAGPEVTCPPSHPQDSRVEYGEGGRQSQVTWRQNT